MRSLVLAAAAAAAVVAAPHAARAQGGYKVVVNAGNPVASLKKDEVSRLFLKRTTLWPNHRPVTVVDLQETSPVRREFSRAVHNRDVSSVKSFWQQQVFSGRAVPPVERTTDAEVLGYVAATPNAIGYVAANATLPDGVKVVRIE